MKQKLYCALALLSGVCCLPSILRAQEATVFTYQGRLGANGVLANGSYDFRFSIYDSTNSPGVLIAGPLTNFMVAVSNGLFITPLDFGVAPFNGSDRWLDISVRTNGAGSFTTLTTRQQITLAPYAIMSRSALFAVSNFTVGASLVLPPTNPAIYSGNQTLFWSDSYNQNVFVGPAAGAGGQGNTGMGDSALALDGGGANSAFGNFALSTTTSGFDNTAIGDYAMSSYTNGYGNTGLGAFALGSAFSAGASNAFNTAEGFLALTSITSGNDNTANGYDAMLANTSGTGNTADGALALYGNSFGGYNVAVGFQALYSNSGGSHNTAVGDNSLYSYTGVGYNVAIGDGALQLLTSGNDNIGIGDFGGHDITSGSWNIHIGNPGTSGDTHTIKIGQQGTQSATFIAGISGTSISGGAPVYVNSSGQLGSANASFVQTAAVGNTFNVINVGDVTEINDALCNGKPGAILMVTRNLNNDHANLGHPYSALYWTPDSKWVIAVEGGSISSGEQFNVLVANP